MYVDRMKLLESRGKVLRSHTRDPWQDLPFRGIVMCDGRWIDLRRQADGTISGRPLPKDTGVCVFCYGWRLKDFEGPCEDPPQIDGIVGPGGVIDDDHPSHFYEHGCYLGRLISTYTPSKSPLNLYWVETEDHDEDWFILARDTRQACSLHERYEGYESGYSHANRVASVPSHWLCHGVGHPDFGRTSILEDCGGKRVNYTLDPKHKEIRRMMGVVEEAWEFNGTIYTSGDVTRDLVSSAKN